MSIRAVAWALSVPCPSPLAKLVLLKLAEAANDEGECWPPQSKIAADCGISRRSVNRHLQALVEVGLLRSEHRFADHNGQKANHYSLPYDRLSQGGTTDSQGRYDTPVVPGTTTASHQEPSLEPSENLPPLNPPRGNLVAEFNEWWLAYPHKVGKGAAEAKYRIARKTVTQAELLDGVARYKRTKPDDRPWCNPATWLFQKRWLDEPDLPLVNGHDDRPPPAPLNPRMLGHSLPCSCPNCSRWTELHREEVRHA